MSVLLRADGPVTLVGAGPVEARQLAAALELAPEAIGLDGGGDVPLPGGRSFRAVIGDMDSLRSGPALRAAGTALHRLVEQETTDLEKCLYSVEAPLYVVVGCLGGRLDHNLAAMNALVKFPDKRVILVGAVDLCFHCPRELALELEAGTRVSLFPMAPVRAVAGEGLRWPLAGPAFRPDGRIGHSNLAVGGPVRLAFDAPGMLVILPERLLAVVARALHSG